MRLSIAQVGHWCGAMLRTELGSLFHVDAERAIGVIARARRRRFAMICCWLAVESGEWPANPGHCIGKRGLDVRGVKQERPSSVNVLDWTHRNAWTR